MTSESNLESDTRTHRDIAVLLAAASALTDSPSLIDRMSNALNPEPAIRAVSDALRVLQSDQASNLRRLSVIQTDKGYVTIVDENRRIFGRPPSGEDVRRFIEEVQRDVSLARKIGTFASALLVDALLRELQEQEKAQEGG